jgi:chromate transporter
MPDFWTVLLEFLRYGILSFGGGVAMLSEMSRSLVTERHWLATREFTDGFALGQFVPGPNMLAMMFYGFRAAGLAGAFAGFLGMFLPGAIASSLLARAWERVKVSKWSWAIRAALLPIGLGLSAGGVLSLTRAAFSSLNLQTAVLAGILTVLAAFLIYTKRVNTMTVILLTGLIGALLLH